MKRVLKLVFVTAISAIAVSTLTLVFTLILIIATKSGTQFVWQHAKAFLPTSVKITSLEGRLTGPLELRGLKVRTDSLYLELDRIELHWALSGLFRSVVDIESITLDGLRYTQLESAPRKADEESTATQLPEEIILPLDVRLGILSLRDFEFRSEPEADPFVINSGMLTAVANKHIVDISSLKVESPLFTIVGNTSLTTDQDYLVKGKLLWQVSVPGYPAATGRTVLDGSLSELTIKQTIDKPYVMQAEVLLRDTLSNLTFEAALEVGKLKLPELNNDYPDITAQLRLTSKGNPNNVSFNLSGWTDDHNLDRVTGTLAGRLKSQQLTIDELKITIPGQPAQLKAGGQVDMTGEPELNLEVDWQQLQWPLRGTPLINSPIGTMKLTGTTENLLARLDIALGDRGKIEGNVIRENEVVDIGLDWTDLQWPLQQPKIQSPKGHLAAVGKIDNYSLDLRANLLVPEQTGGQLMIEGHGNRDTLYMSKIEMNLLEGKLEGEVNLSWAPEVKGEIDFVGRALNPGVVLNDWPGRLEVALHAQGSLKDGKPNLQLHQLDVQGQLRGYQLSLDASGAYEENLTILDRFALSSGSTKLEAGGTIGDTFDVNWQFNSDDLGTLLLNASGRIDGKGTLAGPVKRPQVAFELTAEEVVHSDYRLDALMLNANIDVSGKNQSNVSLNLEEGHAAGVELRKIALNGQGNNDAHRFTLNADTSSGQADITIQGELQYPWEQDMSWNFSLDQGKLKYPDLDAWTLQTPSKGHIAAGHTKLSQSCWQSQEALLCLKGQKSQEGVQADFSLTDLPFSYFFPYLPPDIKVQGSLSGSGAFNQSVNKESSFSTDISTTKVRLLPRDSSEKQQDAPIVEFQPGDIHLQMQQGEFQGTIKLPLSQTDGITFQAAISPSQGPLIEWPLNGQLITKIENLDFIANLIPEVQDLAGKLKGNLVLAGSLSSPVLKGNLALDEGAAKLESPGLHLKDIRAELTGEGDSGIRLNAHAVSEGGELNIDGFADLRGKATIADIKVKGENFRVINTLEAQIDASPDLSIVIGERRTNVEGKVMVPHAQIKLKTRPESAVIVSSDQVIINPEGQEKANNTPGREMHARVRIVLGDRVRFNGFGLKARIEGNILAVEKPDVPTTGSGELTILDGEYRAYGQGLVIEKGRILFAGGPINRPGLDVEAVRRPAQGIVVGVLVRGNLRKPDFKLFSDPVMTQGNQLSYLVIGRPMSGTSGSEGLALSRAALALGLKGENNVAEKIGGKLGLDQFGVDSGKAGSGSSTEQASLVVGKYLSPKLYVSYGLGLFDPVSTVRLQYAINSRWEFVTESSGTASGGDVIYTIETGN